ncbi:M13 family metallopeptidase [Sphingomonas ginkgonis]|uniref:M13 family metallopeptidase n=1 Tax=Sphingomonas ginkgonis TaxID=2315330 RepID=UPI001EF03D69|nr:M13 family metallopeptidase [Sphingomonas ginkgonis]
MSASAQAAKPVYGTWGYDQAAMNSQVKPGDDFWQFANGAWDARTQIPADRTSTGPFVTLSDKSEQDVRTIIENMEARPSDRLSQQVGGLYASYMDTATIEKLGLAPVRPYLARINAVQNRQQLVDLMFAPGFASPIGVGITPDLNNPNRYVASVGQGGLGLPSREYYLLDNPKMADIRSAYRDYIVNIRRMAGLPGGAEAADRIIALETAIAKVQWERARLRDVNATNNPMDRAKLNALAPEIAWTPALAKIGLGSVDTVIVRQPSAITDTAKILAATPLPVWKDYMAFRFISDHATALPKSFDDARFAFYSAKLTGVQSQRERWKRGVALVNGALGEGVGKIYVQQHFPASSEAQIGELITNLREAYQERIQSNPWMDQATRTQALAKLAAFDPRIGHPVKYIDYSPYVVKKGDLLGNTVRAEDFQWKLMLSRLPKPVDRSLWSMTPQTINAYYSPLTNQITFPAAILQPPFFDPNADPAANYGAIGAVIGHEIGHGFDDQGRKFDPTGKVRDWWTAEAASKFEERTTRLGAQYSAFSPFTGVNLNGKLTMGENIGDLGGVETAYAALQKYQAKHGALPVINGFTPDQRFFLAYAQAWQAKQREDAMRQQILTDPHSPAVYRVNGVVRNVDAWYKAFNIQPGDKLYLAPDQRVHIW